MGLPIEDPIEMSLGWGWENLKEYLSNVEHGLQEATKRFESRVAEHKKTLKPGEVMDEFMADNVEEYVKYYDEFPYMLRNSFFISAYALLEFDKGWILRMLRKRKQKVSELSNVTSSEACQETDKYRMLRNCIVHKNGLLKKNDEDYETLFPYAKGKGLVKERYIIVDVAAEEEIGLTEDFCKEAVDTMQKFIDAVYKDSIKKLGK